MEGLIKIRYEDVMILKGMNSNFVTSQKECDYRFISRLLLCVFNKDVLRQGCVRIEGARETASKYNLLDPIKFNFVKCNLISYRKAVLN